MIDPSFLDIEDFAALLSYLRVTGRITNEERPLFTNLAGGVSNRTVLLQRETGESWVLKQALKKLRVRVEWLSDPRRIEREAIGMRRLAEIAPPGSITPLIFLDEVPNLLAMQAVPMPHENWKTALLGGRLDSSHVTQFAELLAAIHRAGWDRREQFAVEFEDRSFFESLRLEPYYLYTAREVPEAAVFLNELVAQTRSTRYTLVHGDYSPKNILVHQGRLVLLDHEVIHFGDGAFDLGFALTHLLSKAHHLPQMRNEFAKAARQFWSVYRNAIGNVPWGDELEPRVVRHTLACLLARCRGRSPLEYLDERGRDRQASAVVKMMSALPVTVGGMAEDFLSSVTN